MTISSPSLTATPITTFEQLVEAVECLLHRIDTRLLAPIYRTVLWQAHQELLRHHPFVRPCATPDRALLRVAHLLHEARIDRVDGTRMTVEIADWFKQGEIVHVRVVHALNDEAEHTCRILECSSAPCGANDDQSHRHLLTLEKL